MDNLSKKQKIISIMIITIMILVIGYYIMNKTKQYNELEIDSIVENSDEKEVTIKEENEIIIVHITGSVVNEGIVQINYGARISDVINKAGGTTSEANLSKVNLAYMVQDGQKIYIPSIYDGNEVEDAIIIEDDGDNIIVGGNIESNNKLVNINKASQTELETLNGIGPSTALKIIEYRKENGNFKTIEEIMNVPGIGEAKFESIKNDICI